MSLSAARHEWHSCGARAGDLAGVGVEVSWRGAHCIERCAKLRGARVEVSSCSLGECTRSIVARVASTSRDAHKVVCVYGVFFFPFFFDAQSPTAALGGRRAEGWMRIRSCGAHSACALARRDR